ESLQITNPTTIPVTWAGSTDTTWSNVGPLTGTTTVLAPSRLDVSVDASTLSPGQTTTNVFVKSTSADVAITVRIPVTVTVTGSQITIDTPPASAHVPSAFTIAGWALDTTSASGTGVDAILVYADPNPGSGAARQFLGAATYGVIGRAHV